LEETNLSKSALLSSGITALSSSIGYTGTSANIAAARRILSAEETWRTLCITTTAIDWRRAAADRGTVAAKTVIAGIIDTYLVETAITDRWLLVGRTKTQI
jgi:hypothetical protein